MSARNFSRLFSRTKEKTARYSNPAVFINCIKKTIKLKNPTIFKIENSGFLIYKSNCFLTVFKVISGKSSTCRKANITAEGNITRRKAEYNKSARIYITVAFSQKERPYTQRARRALTI